MNTTWRELTQRFAIGAREFSDAVASLGQETHLGPELWEVIRAKLKLCIATADEIDQYLKRRANAADAK
jgi:hypothetical protein